MEVINSFFGNIKNKFTNPFFGTLMLVLILHHWKLIFGLLNFDKKQTLREKLNFIEGYIESNITLKSFAWDSLQALLYMIFGYLIIVLTRSIVLWIELWLMPIITGKVINKKVVLRSDYEKVLMEREQYFDQYEEQRRNVRDFSKTIDDQVEQIKKKDNALLENRDTIDQLNEKNNEHENKLNELFNEKTKLLREKESLNEGLKSIKRKHFDVNESLRRYKDLYFSKESQMFYASPDKFSPKVISKVRELKSKNEWGIFLRIGSFFEEEYSGPIRSELFDIMRERGLIFEKNKGLTPVGEIIYHYRDCLDEVK